MQTNNTQQAEICATELDATAADAAEIDITVPCAITRLSDTVDLSGHRNNTAISAATDTKAGKFNVWGNSFAAEYLPEGKSLVHVANVPFEFPPVLDGPDNVRCEGQFLTVPTCRYDWVHVLAASERRCEDTLQLNFADGSTDAEPLRVSDFWGAPAWFGEIKAFESLVMHYPHHVQRGVPAVMWAQRVPVTRRADLTGIRLPRNIAVHVFAITLQRSPCSERRPCDDQ
ncbi:hypothetical protein ACQB60_31305 [Actinomycetota bacterium Odt1-20B]